MTLQAELVFPTFSTSPTGGKPIVKTSHPWLGIIHPGPWTLLPPAPPPVATPLRSNLQGSWYRPRLPPPNPFVEEVYEETCEKAAECEPADQTKGTVDACHSESGVSLANNSGDANVAGDAEKTAIQSDNDAEPLDKPVPPKRQEGVSANTVETSSELSGSTISSSGLEENRGTGGSLLDVTAAAEPQASSHEAQSHLLLRSVSVPAIASAYSHSSSEPDGPTEEDGPVTSCQSKVWPEK